MSKLQGRPEAVAKQITAVAFGFYTEEEVRAISVKQITSPVLFDNLRHPAADGLYDAALGPLDAKGSCATCGLGYYECPGHFGHIALAVPVYHPLVFPVLYKLLRATCLHCHHFKMDAKRVAQFSQRLHLIAAGRLKEALTLADIYGSADNSAKKKKGDEMEGESVEDTPPLPGVSSALVLQDAPAVDVPAVRWTSHCLAAARDVVREFLEKVPKAKCDNCSASAPALKVEGKNKIFQMPLAPKAERANAVLGIHLRSVLEGAAPVDVTMEDTAGAQAVEGDSDEEGALPLAAPAPKATPDKGKRRPQFLTSVEVREHLRRLWDSEGPLLRLIWAAEAGPVARSRAGERAARRGNEADALFLQALLVPPNKFRPTNKLGDVLFEHPQNFHLQRILTANMTLAERLRAGAGWTAAWLELQQNVSGLLDSTAAASARAAGPPGIRQQLEKKEGLFRKNMMGKRVNYACRSVISPDPYIGVAEIGIPPYFATRLTFPESVTQWNVDQLRAAVENGPDVHPGATHVENERGVLVNLAGRTAQQRAAIAKTLLSLPGAGAGTSAAREGAMQGRRAAAKAVYRHLRDGDCVLVNRQPTLHKPGLMAHSARVLRGEKTLRMHYANCSTYNADFDGDEMNVHFPQDELGRAEAAAIVSADEQYIVPTSGAPIRGLIQDHIVAAALLTSRDTFLTRSEYAHLVYAGCGPLRTVAVPGRAADGRLLCVDKVYTEADVKLLPPALVRPRPLWTGKQVVTTLLNQLTAGQPPLTLTAGTKVPADYWGRSSGETEVVLAGGELVAGVLDKAQFGKYGLVHAVQELYGAHAAGRLLSALSRLFTAFLQMHGFTCSIDDLLLTPPAEASRAERIRTAENEVGDRVHATFGGVAAKDQEVADGAAIREGVGVRLRTGGVAEGVRLDLAMTSALNPITSAVIKDCLPGGQRRPFPHNTMSLMTVTGAKGSMVNASQISALLGQQELEGRRVPRMASGKTLPCFAPFDTAPRAGGFIADRFLTGLKPQEYYFHCMAGRDGLVDTTVKTSRSGYLQRCLVKNLECLAVGYDHSVRDSDGGLVQFLYGEDGLDVTRTSHLRKLDFLARNRHAVTAQACLDGLDDAGVERLKHKKSKADPTAGTRVEEDDPREQQLTTAQDSNPPSTLGAVSESFRDALDGFLTSAAAKGAGIRGKAARGEFRRAMEARFMQSLAAPGEPVGVLAAQSIGEPSTQMTLNTFHFAGRGEANVTLGIPRLREILMTAAAKIATPVMTIPMRKGVARSEAEALARRLTRVTLAEVCSGVEVGERPLVRAGGKNSRTYRITLRFHAAKQYPAGLELSLEELAGVVREGFVGRLKAAIKAANKKGARTLGTVQVKGGDEQAGEGDDEEGGGGARRGRRKEQDEDEPEGGEEEGEDLARETARHTQNKSYDEPDEEEAAMADSARRQAEEQEGLGWGEDDDGGERPSTSNRENGEDTSTAVVPVRGKTGAAGKAKETEAEAAARVTAGDNSCSVEITVPVGSPKLMMLEIVEKVLAGVEVRHVPGIARAFVLEGEDSAGQIRLQTDGINFEGVMNYADVVDVDRITTNDVTAMLRMYGVEVARATILSEVSAVFGAYGIAVDQRHLSLIADFMTFHGAYRPCNRLGIESSPSPFLKMSFETATHFLTDATLQGQTDHLESPSARIVVGRVVEVGTGAFDLLQNVGLARPAAAPASNGS